MRENAISRWRALLTEKTGGRKLFIATGWDAPAPKAEPFHLSMHWPERHEDKLRWALADYRDQLARNELVDDDSVPFARLITGTEIFAECFGCPVARSAETMPFALPAVTSAEQAAKLETPPLMDTPLKLQFDMADRFLGAEPDALLQLPDIQSPLDIAALIWRKEDFFLALLEEPEAVDALCGKVRALLTAFLDEWFRRYGTRYVAHFPGYYMEGGLTLSEDEIGAMSEDCFRRFGLGELNALSDRYGGIGIHCCANARHQWKALREVRGLRLINLVQPADVTRRSVRFFADACAQWPMPSDEALYADADGFSEARMVLSVNCAGMSAREASQRVANLRRLNQNP